MDRYNFFKGNAAGISSLLQMAMPPIVAVVCLVVLSEIFDGRFAEAHVMLATLAALLVFIITSQRIERLQTPTDDLFQLTARITVEWSAVVGILLLIGFATKYSAYFSRQILFTWAAVTPACIILSLYFVRLLTLRYALRTNSVRKAVIVGINDSSIRLAAKIDQTPALGLELLGFFDDRTNGRTKDSGHPRLGSLADVNEIVRDRGVDTVFVALPMRTIDRGLDVITALRDSTASIYYVPDVFVFDLIRSEIKSLRGVPVISLCETPYNGKNYLVKRLMDLVGAAGLLVALAPLMLAVAAAVKASSPGPVLFKQRRYGLDGAEIRVFKFRSMTVMEDGNEIKQASQDDDRVTRVGRFLRRSSLDELPQLFNVLRGEMSLVGPRPHAVAHNEQYRSMIEGYMIRHKVMPGITGLAQVNGYRGETQQLSAMESRVHYDLEYMRTWSLWLDFKILLRTITAVVRDPRAY